ncbi:MAG: helix-turn-helix transcriptional regulator [Flavobacteriales bacterium]|nr:helix-turn-helix transcriptional regulator [Bacteroidota bacterium]MCB9241901.1 helix-turn-helix transcriptional regulator [Flavobacteriales bacterium]
MSESIRRFTSIHELMKELDMGSPSHPLITVIDASKMAYGEDVVGIKFTSDMYCISLKDGSCGMEYGRNTYDFNDGVLSFWAPDQVLTMLKPQALDEVQGWLLYFHANLIRNTSLGQKMDAYSFFDYDVHEALHLSDKEQAVLTDLVELIRQELAERIDNHSQQVLVSNLELMLNYCTRFYERQFNTRSSHHKDVLAKVEWLLKEYYRSNQIIEHGQPTIQYLAEECHLSPSYLSDLLKKETGRSAKDHINDFLVEKAKNLLLSSDDSVSEIAYSLGFNYPHYFTRLFKAKTGYTPVEFRQVN